MKFSLRLLLIFIFTLVANPVSAAVIINEVAWMGSLASANHEWIELYNNGGENINLDGWVLSDSANLNITLTGTISAGQYAVLERTSEESAAGTAFLIYTGALVNTGTTLTLRDSAGQIMDQAAGGIDWENMGGDNVAKNTAQYTSSGWVTDVPTPGRANGAGIAAESENTSINTSTTSTNTNTNTTSSSGRSSGSSKSTSATSVKLKNEETDLKLVTNIQSIAYVNQLVPFAVVASGLAERGRLMAKYEWNFGDTHTTNSRKVEHSYKYPGKYVVTVYARHEKNEQVARHEITVLPVSFSVTRNDKGDIQIHNDATYDVDLSSYTIRGVEEIIMPPRSIIMPRSTITIEAGRLGGMTNSLIALYDTKGILVTSTFKEPQFIGSSIFNTNEVISSRQSNVAARSNITANPSPVVESNDFNFITKVAQAEELASEDFNEPSIEAVIDLGEAPSKKEARWPYLAFIGLILLALLGIFATKTKSN
jgi:hypothetical protein